MKNLRTLNTKKQVFLWAIELHLTQYTSLKFSQFVVWICIFKN